jgi:hypothetical protein
MFTRIDETPKRLRVTLPASSGIVSPLSVMRIVARRTLQRPIAFQKALRFSQPVNRSRDFEFIVAAFAGRMIEVQHEIAKRLPWLVGKWRALISDDRSREARAGRLQVALHAHFHLPFRR